MAEKNNATCKICGKPYHVCMSCADSMKAHPWKAFTDTANCYKVFQVVRGLSTGVYTKDEAKVKFKNIDLKDIESFRPHIKDIIKDVLKEEEVDDVLKEEEVDVERVVTEEVATDKVVEKTTMSRKRINKVEVEAE